MSSPALSYESDGLGILIIGAQVGHTLLAELTADTLADQAIMQIPCVDVDQTPGSY